MMEEWIISGAPPKRQEVDVVTGGGTASDTINVGTKTSTTPGTPVKLTASSTPCNAVVVYAYITNSDTVSVGGSTTLAESNSGGKTGKGAQLMQGAAISIPINDVSKVYLDVVSSGDGVSFVYFK